MNTVILIGVITSMNISNGNKVIGKMKIETKIGFDKGRKEDKTATVPVTLFGFEREMLEDLKVGARVCVQGYVTENQRQFEDNVLITTEVRTFPSGLSIL